MVIEALETKASWVDLFGVTGELNVPRKDTQGELLEPLQRVEEVCGSRYVKINCHSCYSTRSCVRTDIPTHRKAFGVRSRFQSMYRG
jgi:hypothetical protein